MNPPRSRILVVDDVVRNLQIVGTQLRQEGYPFRFLASWGRRCDK